MDDKSDDNSNINVEEEYSRGDKVLKEQPSREVDFIKNFKRREKSRNYLNKKSNNKSETKDIKRENKSKTQKISQQSPSSK